MALYLIHAVRLGVDGTPSELRWASCHVDGKGLHQSATSDVDVLDAVDAIHRDDKVQVFAGGRVGPIVRTLVKADGSETIRDTEGVHDLHRLKNLPTF